MTGAARSIFESRVTRLRYSEVWFTKDLWVLWLERVSQMVSFLFIHLKLLDLLFEGPIFFLD